MVSTTGEQWGYYELDDSLTPQPTDASETLRQSAELIAEVQDWFTQNSANGEIPEESTTRKKIAPIWRALRETA